jgi:hypothetical protein
MSTLPDPLTVEQLTELVADPMWRDEHGRSLPAAVILRYGQVDGARMWNEALDVFEAAARVTPRQRSDWPLQIVASSHTERGAR